MSENKKASELKQSDGHIILLEIIKKKHDGTITWADKI